MKTLLKHSLALLTIAAVFSACSNYKAPTQPMVAGSALVLEGSRGPSSATTAEGAVPAAVRSLSSNSGGSVKGAGGQMPAYYDSTLFTINSVELSDVAGDRVGSNPSHNEIYVTNDLDDEQDFIPVLNAIQGDEFNPLWEQFLIVFNPGVTPHQFFSDDEVHEAAAGSRPEITLVDTHEVYRCSVVGKK